MFFDHHQISSSTVSQHSTPHYHCPQRNGQSEWNAFVRHKACHRKVFWYCVLFYLWIIGGYWRFSLVEHDTIEIWYGWRVASIWYIALVLSEIIHRAIQQLKPQTPEWRAICHLGLIAARLFRYFLLGGNILKRLKYTLLPNQYIAKLAFYLALCIVIDFKFLENL